MSQKKCTWNVLFTDGRSVSVTARGKRMAISKAVVASRQPEAAIVEYQKQGAKTSRLRRLYRW